MTQTRRGGREEGVAPHVLDEARRLADLAWRFHEARDPAGLVNAAAVDMQVTAPPCAPGPGRPGRPGISVADGVGSVRSG